MVSAQHIGETIRNIFFLETQIWEEDHNLFRRYFGRESCSWYVFSSSRRERLDAELATMWQELEIAQGFRKNVSNQFITQDTCKFDDTTCYLFTNKGSINVDVLGSMVKYKILCVGTRTERSRLLNKLTYYMSLAMVEARDLYLASAADLARDGSLFLSPPRDEIMTNKNCKTSGWSTISHRTSPVCIAGTCFLKIFEKVVMVIF